MTRKSTNIGRGRLWLLLPALLAWLLPQTAASETLVEDTGNYSVTLTGSNVITIEAPLCDFDGIDTWISDGNLYYEGEGVEKTLLLHFYCIDVPYDGYSNSRTTIPVHFKTDAGGYLEITQGNSSNKFILTKNSEESKDIHRRGDDYFEFTADWILPYNLLGKKLTFTWKVERNKSLAYPRATVSPSPRTITVPEAAEAAIPIVTPATLNPKSPGVLELPWFLAAKEITSIKYEYDDANGSHKVVSMPNSVNNGIIKLNANEPHRDFQIVTSYYQEGARGKYLIEDIKTDAKSTSMIHAPVGLTASPLGGQKAKVEVSWNVTYLDDEDLAITDFFEIQRSLTGKEEDFVGIGQEIFSQAVKKSSYTFVDSTLVDAISDGMLKNGGTLDNLTYRVRRAITKDWGWGSDNNCAASTRCVLDDLHLLCVTDYSAKWEDERAYTVRVTWQYGDETGGVWDNRARMMVRLIMKNRDGAVIGTQEFPVSPAERQQRYKVVNCTRPCVKYDIEIYVERGESPINFIEDVTEYFFPIRTSADWTAFRDKVKAANGKYDVNARLYADVNAGSVMVGSETENYYRGTFDGNGHTLTFNINTSNEYAAPFRYVGNATFRNLHTTGTIRSSRKFIAGIVGGFYKSNTNSTVVFEGCRSSVTLNSSVNGDATNGGLMAIAYYPGDSVAIRNCKFDGSLEGANCHSNGGFVGYTNSPVTIENSVFEPNHLTTQMRNCATWARIGGTGSCTLVNSYATTEYISKGDMYIDGKTYMVLHDKDDWTTFKNRVENAKNSEDVNAYLDADITVTDYVGGSETAPFRGIFDGNGHTLTLNLNSTSECIAPFRYVSKATIKNLHVKGTINTSSKLAGGLVSQVIMGGSVVIESCHSSVTLNSTVNGDATMGGFVAYAHGASATLRNCKFDGSFIGSNCYYNGGIVGYTDLNGEVNITNCLFAPERISTKTDYADTWARKDNSSRVNVNNSKATREMTRKFITIRNANDWETFRNMTEESGGVWVDASLMADISITAPVGYSNRWRGTFEGNGHTLTINLNSNSEYIAPFRYVSDATIKNLHVTGTINTSSKFAGGLIAQVNGGSVVIEKCRSSVTLNSTVNGDATNGGFVADAVYNSNLTFRNCKFDGSFTGSNCHSNGGFVGINNSTLRIENCLFAPDHIFTRAENCDTWARVGARSYTLVNSHATMGYNNPASDWSNKSASDMVRDLGSSNWEVVDGKAVPKMSPINPWATMSADELRAALGSEYWEVVDGRVVPVMTTISSIKNTSEDSFADKLGNSWTRENGVLVPVTTTVPYYDATVNPKPTLPDFYHASNGKIEPELMTQTRQSSVLLTWNTDGNPIDYYRVMRRVKGETDESAWTEVATNLDQMSYEDKTVSPLETYEYKVLAVNDCEGVTFTETEVKVGECKHTGRVEGYVRYNDGTSAAGIEVSVYVGDDKITSTFTDDSGYFVVDELSYNGKTSMTYVVTPTPANSKIKFDEPFRSSVTFNAKSNNETLREFTINSGKLFSGFVMYDGTSIPVKGAHFKVNGRNLYNGKGDLLETEYDGSFSFRVNPGRDTIQVVMDGHTFVDEGYYKSKNGHDFTADVAQTYFYDDTKVKLTGRMVGGDDQGKLPLGNNLSRNNLGDKLRMVLTLEGDNTSWLVYDNLNPNRTERETTYQHPRGNGHKTWVKTTRKRIEVAPDSITGEYELTLPPVRWKVQQVYCDGYPTLFQEGQVSEVIDLTDCLVSKDTTYTGTYKDVDTVTVANPELTYNAIYNRIYHSPKELTYKQLGYDDFSYFGDKTYTATDVLGNKFDVPLAYKNPADTTKASYTFQHPVFSLERKYYIQVQVAESYPYNNDKRNGKIDYVRVGGGKATMYNGMKALSALDYKKDVELDSLGQGVFELTVDQTTQLLTGESALKRVNFSVEQDGTFYEAEPLYGYILNMFPIGAGKDVLTDGQPILFDILRDPPGGSSSNSLAKGTTLNYSYSVDMSLMAGLLLNFTLGSKMQTYAGTVVAPSGVGSMMGVVNSSDAADMMVSDLIFTMAGNKGYSYTMNIGHTVSTSSDPSMVGADADLYIGAVQNLVVMPMSSIRAIPDVMYKNMTAGLGQGLPNSPASELAKKIQYGSLVHIAEGKDAKGNKFHLVRDQTIGYGPKLQSQFFYSQKQILTQIIPQKAKEILDMMFVGTETEAKQLANRTQFPVYLSLRQPTDSLFGVMNTKVIPDHAYNTTIKVAQDSINYLVVLPDGKAEADFNDEIAAKNQIIYAWAKMITRNEREKLEATDLVANYDIAGAEAVNYSETFDSNTSNMTMTHFPFGKQPDYFDAKGSGIGMSVAQLATETLITAILGIVEATTYSYPGVGIDPAKFNQLSGMKSEVSFSGGLFQWLAIPIMYSQVTGADVSAKSYNRTESFTIVNGPNNHLNVDVYRVKRADSNSTTKVDPRDIYTNNNYNSFSNLVNKYLNKESKMELNDEGEILDLGGSRSFVFRTRGGATADPWEGERKTHFYEAGTVLDERTLKIDNPKIWLDKQSVSGVSINDAARFKVFMANESEKPEATDGLSVYQLFSMGQANPKGAKIFVDGEPLSTGGTTVTVVPGNVTEKTIEVRAGDGFDYEGLTIGIMSPSDAEQARATTTFDVHFLREAGAVTIATPGDKWVLNTSAQSDDKRGWYIPVTINGFDRHQHNFDHIEFQYKESQRGDDSWVNLCSYYADSTLMANANGVCELMQPNANIVTNFYGEGFVMEKSYDLRAVLFCRNGNDFLTTSSKVVSGIKDTRRPQLFGSPEPKGGLLYLGNDIIFNFSEDIDYNHLSAITNFEVRGEVNNNDLSETVSIQFKGQASVESEAKRNFSGKDLTIDLMVKPDSTGREMPLFSHGSNGQKLQLWLTADYRLKAVVGEQTFVSNSAIMKGTFTQVAVSINQQDSTLTFFNGGEEIGRGKLNSLYNGTGTLIFGRTNEMNRNESQYYEGRMMEARLWYAAMDGGLIGTTYGSRRLTGYERDLVDYYPMNEGSGKYVIDHTQGANARLMGASWAIPRGMSLGLKKEDKGVQLKQTALNRTSDQDYTLMFWFRTDADGRGTLLSNGRGLKEDDGADNQFHIGFEGDTLTYRSNGFVASIPGNWSDNEWHHYAMTVNRGRNVANIYVDKELRTTFGTDSLGGISGGYPLIGASRYILQGTTEPQEGEAPLKGNVDELLFFAQALPQTLINTYATKSPKGDEYGLLTYLSFDRQERQKNNDIEMVPYLYSRKVYLDDKREVRYELDPETQTPTNIPVRDYLFVDTLGVVMPHIDQTQAAPVVPYEEIQNLKFSFIGRDNQLLVELDEPAAKLHRRNIYVTVRDIEDKNGNTMASPQTACFNVSNNSLEWLVNRLDTSIKYGSGESCDLPFINNDAVSHTYKIENCPKWLTLDHYNDVIAPQNLRSFTATVSKDLNVGTYNEILYLTDEQGITEPFYLNLTIEGEQPDWAKSVSGDLLRYSMNISGQVYLYDELDTDSRDIVGVFDDENTCHGFANITSSEQAGETGLFLTVYDKEPNGRDLNFRLWQYSTGREIVLTPTDSIKFVQSAVLGSDTPVRFDGGEAFVQNFNLKKGWNWVSFNVNSKQLSDVNKLLSSMRWSDGDILTELDGSLTLNYEQAQNRWVASGSTEDVVISPLKSYAISVKEDCTFPIGGIVIKEKADRTVTLKQGWNGIGYTPMTNLTIETALSDYYDQAEQGDVIKSHTEFAYFTKSGNTGRWRGSLQYMKPGEGYMMLRKGKADASFAYPFYELNSNFREDWGQAARRSAPQSVSTMSVSATVAGFEPEEGDRLVAYSNGQEVGVAAVLGDNEAEAPEPLYLSIAGESQQKIWFAIERDGEIVASTSETMTFNANAVIGSPDEPTVINFVHTDYEDGKWYSINGMLLPKKPTQRGLYIFSGKKVVIK